MSKPENRIRIPTPRPRYVCKCECGGKVYGVEQFGMLFTWCDRCTPAVTVNPFHPFPPMTAKQIAGDPEELSL